VIKKHGIRIQRTKKDKKKCRKASGVGAQILRKRKGWRK